MITKKIFLKKYNGKCDCCHRVTLIKGKLEVTDPEDTCMLIGELQLCGHCMPLLSAYLSSEPKRQVIEDDDDDILDNINFEVQDFDPSSLPADAVEL
ncbi:Uncharacterised protein [Chlamydia trachomatis]|nr:Uncharacterised protein [Chlamydia trachomatis]